VSQNPFSVVHVAAEEVRASPDYQFDNNARPDRFSFVIQRTIAGAGFFRQGAQRQLVPAGSAMLFSHAEASFYGYPPEAREPYHFHFISFSADGLASLFGRLRADFGSVVRLPEESEAAAVFHEIIGRARKRQFRDRLHETELLHRLLIAIYREQIHGTRTSEPIEFGFHYLQNHFRSPVNLKDVAARCGVSREHFIREFGTRYHESPGAMLRRLRLEHAQTLLAASSLSVQDVALASGFTSSNTFCRAYRRKFACSPGAGR
jgi:AraC-like DNA-binding protein